MPSLDQVIVCLHLQQIISRLNIFNIIFIVVSIYVISAYYYLQYITRRYLKKVDNFDQGLSGKKLRTNQEVRDSLKERSTINILVLTGGGVRGLGPLKVLTRLEELTGKKAGELFDVLAGTSTGAINCAIMSVPNASGGFKFTAAEIARNYRKNVRKMFSAPLYHKIFTLFGMLGPRYLPKGKLEVLKSYFGGHTLADLHNYLLIPVYDVSENSLKIIRSWEPAINGQYNNYSLLDLVNGASNPPMLFSPRTFTINGKPKVFIDPGVVINNPAEIALLNSWFMFPNKKLRIVLISNGGNDSGKYGHSHMTEFGAYGLFQYLLNSPVISTKFSTDLVNEYIHEARDYGLNVDFVYLQAATGENLATGNVSEANMQRIESFAEKLISENQEKIQYLAQVLTNSN